MASLGHQTPSSSDMVSGDAADEFATFESPFPFSTIDWDDLIADEIAFSRSMPFTTLDSDDFILVLGLTQWDDMDGDICCESRYLDSTDFLLKRCSFERELAVQHDIKEGKEKACW
jgi:hypothetical protein